MQTINNIKQKLGENTEKLEQQTKRLWTKHSHHYTHLESWQRGLLLLTILVFLVLAIYYLTHESQERQETRQEKKEAALEEQIIKRMELLKKLRE